VRLLSYYNFSSHTRTVVRVCFKGNESSQWKRPKFDPSPHQNPLTKIGRRDYVLDCTGMQNFVTIGSGVSVPQTRNFAVLLGD